MSNHENEVWIWTGKGEGYWVSKEEYENSYRDSEKFSAQIDRDEDRKYRQMADNRREAEYREANEILSEGKKSRHLKNAEKLIEDNLKSIIENKRKYKDDKELSQYYQNQESKWKRLKDILNNTERNI